MIPAFGASPSKTYNEKYCTVDSLLQGRFKDEHVGDAGYLMGLARYLHRHSVKARLCAMPEHWLYSNYCDVIGKCAGDRREFSTKRIEMA